MRPIYCLIFLSLLAFAAAAQPAKFDIVTYTAPAGWDMENHPETVMFKKVSDGNFCLISLSKSVESSGSSSSDFQLFWQGAVVEQMNVKTEPQRGKRGKKDGWDAEAGIAPLENGNLKGAAILTTYTGGGKFIGVLVVTNSDVFEKDIEAFVNNLKLPPIAGQTASTPAANTGDSAKLIGRWQRSGSSNPSYADPASWGTSGYTKCRYEFKPDGTYVYTERSFRYSYQNIIVVRENGRYTLSGNTLTVTPAKSTISAYKKAGGVDALGPVVSTQNRKLETVAYKLTFHYFSGIQEWNLVLQADAPTQRDGQFSTLKVFDNAWYFDQKFISGDLTAVRAN